MGDHDACAKLPWDQHHRRDTHLADAFLRRYTISMAAWTNCFFQEVSPGKADDVASIKCIEPLLINIIGAIVSLAAVAFFVMLLVGGFNFLFSGGDPKKLE